MGQVYVAVDLETTGLDADRDAIIELGAVRFRDGQVLETFSQVVNPGRPIPTFIQQLTGISQAEVDRAPDLARVASKFRSFIGDHPLVGHNIGFDAGFLRSHGLYRFNTLMDTWELALILLPGLPSYKLGRVAEHLGLNLDNAHRAFDDAQVSMHIFEALRERAADLPRQVLRQINKLAANSDWSLRGLFAEAEHEAAGRWGKALVPRASDPFAPLLDAAGPLEPLRHPRPLDVEALAGMLKPGGRLAQVFSGYEHRAAQVEMLRNVARAFNNSQHMLIEAGTGTGKSIAYLIPAVAWAVQTGERVVVSSNTINLQDQLYHKDLPDLLDILPFEFRVAVMKGRSNYLCQRRLHNLMTRGDLTAQEISVLARILVWLPTTETGDQNEITLVDSREYAIWQRVAADSASCTPDRCSEQGPHPCFFYRARRKAEAAHVIIVNHALLLADIATENNVLPRYQRLIVDEAHHLEDATTRALGATVDHAGFAARLRELAPSGGEGKSGGLLAGISAAVGKACPADKAAPVLDLCHGLAGDAPLLDLRMRQCFDAIDGFLQVHSGRQYENNSYDLRLRLTEAQRVQPAWQQVEIACDNLALALGPYLENLLRLLNAVADLSNFRIEQVEDLMADLQMALRALGETFSIMNAAIIKPDENTIYWVRRSRQNGDLALHSAPLTVGGLIERHLFMPKDTVILTSATLRTANSFDYLRQRLGAQDAGEIALDSPFDYGKAALIYLPMDMPEPNQPTYQVKVEEAILQLSLATEGRLLALFTSYSQLQQTATALRPLLEQAGLTLYVQGGGGSRQQILEAFRETGRAVLMGTRSFWEGVDVQGEALSALVIARLPFAVPTDPIVAARSETFDSPFYEYSMPEAILNLRQGFGRLIRSARDRGVCAILDRRITSKSYGVLFLESLPDCTVHRGPLHNLPLTARRWLAGEAPLALEAEIFPDFSDLMLEPPPPPEWWD